MSIGPSEFAQRSRLVTLILRCSVYNLARTPITLTLFTVFIGLSRKMQEYNLELGNGSFLPHSFDFIIQCSPNIRRYMVRTSGKVVKWTKKGGGGRVQCRAFHFEWTGSSLEEIVLNLHDISCSAIHIHSRIIIARSVQRLWYGPLFRFPR
jgi:hypothetical protein